MKQLELIDWAMTGVIQERQRLESRVAAADPEAIEKYEELTEKLKDLGKMYAAEVNKRHLQDTYILLELKRLTEASKGVCGYARL